MWQRRCMSVCSSLTHSLTHSLAHQGCLWRFHYFWERISACCNQWESGERLSPNPSEREWGRGGSHSRATHTLKQHKHTWNTYKIIDILYDTMYCRYIYIPHTQTHTHTTYKYIIQTPYTNSHHQPVCLLVHPPDTGQFLRRWAMPR